MLLPDAPDFDFHDPTQSPGLGWVFRGPEQKGSWYNPQLKRSLRPDLHHEPPVGHHWDYRDSEKQHWRVYEDKQMVKKL